MTAVRSETATIVAATTIVIIVGGGIATTVAIILAPSAPRLATSIARVWCHVAQRSGKDAQACVRLRGNLLLLTRATCYSAVELHCHAVAALHPPLPPPHLFHPPRRRRRPDRRRRRALATLRLRRPLAPLRPALALRPIVALVAKAPPSVWWWAYSLDSAYLRPSSSSS